MEMQSVCLHFHPQFSNLLTTKVSHLQTGNPEFDFVDMPLNKSSPTVSANLIFILLMKV